MCNLTKCGQYCFSIFIENANEYRISSEYPVTNELQIL